ncbi:uncharacterized protein FYW47_002357 [Aplochiton taeniatus]
MTELEIDQSHLPRVQEVCQCFAVLEDGALAHNLQEQEIEQYYTTNILKNQLVQNDIRIAKQLQDEEEEQQSQQRALLCQTTRRLEEQDSEYARLIQEEIQMRAEEDARRREHEDEEIAKRIQEEEEQRVRRRSRRTESLSDDSAGSPPSSSPQCQPRQSRHPQRAGGTQHPSATTRWQHSTSHSRSAEHPPDSPRERSQSNPARRSSRRTSHVRRNRADPRETAGLRDDSSGDSDPEVFLAPLPSRSLRPDPYVNTAPCRRSASLQQPRDRHYGSLQGQSGFRQGSRGEGSGHGGAWEDDDGGRGEFVREERRERRRSDEEHGRSRCYDGGFRASEVRQRRYSTSSDTTRHRDGQGDGERTRSWTYREGSDRHVRFQEYPSPGRLGDRSSQVWAMLGQVLRERGVAVRQSARGGPLQLVRPGQLQDGSEGPGAPPPHGALQRAGSTRRSYHGDGEVRRPSSRQPANGDGGHRRGDGAGRPESVAVEGGAGGEDHVEPPLSRDRGGSRRWWRGESRSKVKASTEDQATAPSPSHRSGEEMREERRPRRSPQRTQSLLSREAPTRPRARQSTAGGAVQPQPKGASLDLGELRQVLLDEELARRLQEEEERLLRRSFQSPRPSLSPCNSYPAGDFRAAQVAQDEEIARFIQKQEMKSKRRSRELQGTNPWREPREMTDPPQDRRTTIDRQHVQRERLVSQGHSSPAEDYPAEIQAPSPAVTMPQALHIRNIAEELDPTFKSRSQCKESHREEPKTSAGQTHPAPLSGIHDYLEEPTFIPPTKRQSDKSGRPKSKEKNCKQQ